MEAMLLLSKTFRASWSIGLATALLAAVPSGHVATAENMVGGTSPAHSLDAAASEGAFRYLRALQDIASVRPRARGGHGGGPLPSPSPPRCLHPCLRPLPACVFAPCHVTLAAMPTMQSKTVALAPMPASMPSRSRTLLASASLGRPTDVTVPL